MMGQILKELESPRPVAAQPKLELDPVPEPAPAKEYVESLTEAIETRKTVSQALREWDISSVEKIIIDHDEDARNNAQAEEAEEVKPPSKPWYIRKSTK